MRPIVAAALAGAGGVLVGLRSGTSASWLALLLLALWTLLVRRPPADAGRIVLALYAALGLALGADAAARAGSDCRANLRDGAGMSAIGVLEALPWPDGTVAFRASALTTGSAATCGGGLRVRLPRGAAATEPGRVVHLRGRWWAMPAESPWPRPPERSGTLVATSIDPVEGARLDRTAAVRIRIQQRLRRLLPDRAAFAEALLLARREGLDHDVRRRFGESGLAHLLAISGTHVGLLAGTLVLLAGTLRMAPRAAAVLAAVLVLAYVLFLGAPWAAARAALQVILLLAARLLQRPADPTGLLAAAGLVLGAADPLALLDAGFQLSFAGIFGLIAWRRPLLRRLGRLPRPLADALAAGTAATAATAPIAALHFGQLAVIGILANLVAIPVVAAAIPALGAVLLIDHVVPSAAAFLAGAPDLLLRMLDTIARAAAAVPGGHVYLSATAVLALLAAPAIAMLAAGSFRQPSPVGGRSGRIRFLVLGATTVAVPVIAGSVAAASGRGSLEIHAIDVGQGDAIAIRSPRGRWLLVDAGPRTDRFDAGRRRVVPYLLRHGVRRIDVLIVTHPDADHIGGVPAVFDMLDVGLVIEPGRPTGKAIYMDALDAARREPARWIAARAGRTIRFDDLTIDFLFPDSAALDGPGGANDISAVFRLGFGPFRALFLGDAPMAVEDLLVARHGREMEVELLKVGHHGSRTSTGPALLAAARPRWALVPVGRANRYGHPHPAVIGRLDAAGVRILRTDREGSIRIRVDAAGRVALARTR